MRMKMATCQRWTATTTSRLVDVSVVTSYFFCDLLCRACKPKYDVETLMESGTLDACVAISERLKSSACMLAILVACVRYAMP